MTTKTIINITTNNNVYRATVAKYKLNTMSFKKLDNFVQKHLNDFSQEEFPEVMRFYAEKKGLRTTHVYSA